MQSTYFQNPSNGYIEMATSRWTWLWALLFGPFFFLYKGAWVEVIVYLLTPFVPSDNLLISISAYLLVWIGYAFAARSLLNLRYHRRGWIELPPDHFVTPPSSSPNSPTT